MNQQRNGLGRDAFNKHKLHAKLRGISFEFSYDQWLEWWETELEKCSSRAKRGSRRLNYGMCRYFDRGPYSPGNVYCGRPKRNKADYCSSVYLNSPLRFSSSAGGNQSPAVVAAYGSFFEW
jgi:hypothetical protein